MMMSVWGGERCVALDRHTAGTVPVVSRSSAAFRKLLKRKENISYLRGCYAFFATPEEGCTAGCIQHFASHCSQRSNIVRPMRSVLAVTGVTDVDAKFSLAAGNHAGRAPHCAGLAGGFDRMIVVQRCLVEFEHSIR
jgi:hypothetical protein